MGRLDDLRQFYEQNKRDMEQFLKGCADMGRSSDAKELFRSLCRNLLGPQVKWETAKKAVEHLDKTNCLFKGDLASIEDGLEKCGYRFTNRAAYLYEAQQRFYDKGSERHEMGIVELVRKLSTKTPQHARNMLIRGGSYYIPGLGKKQASHFLRGLGLSCNQLAILDRVILRELVYFGVIKEKPKALNRAYLAIEAKVKDWADNIVGIPLDGLDWLLWKMGRGNGHAC